MNDENVGNVQPELRCKGFGRIDETLEEHSDDILLYAMVLLHGGDTESNICETSLLLPFKAVRKHGHTL